MLVLGLYVRVVESTASVLLPDVPPVKVTLYVTGVVSCNVIPTCLLCK